MARQLEDRGEGRNDYKREGGSNKGRGSKNWRDKAEVRTRERKKSQRVCFKYFQS